MGRTKKFQQQVLGCVYLSILAQVFLISCTLLPSNSFCKKLNRMLFEVEPLLTIVVVIEEEEEEEEWGGGN